MEILILKEIKYKSTKTVKNELRKTDNSRQNVGFNQCNEPFFTFPEFVNFKICGHGRDGTRQAYLNRVRKLV